jgi:hypothetical protein
MYLKESTGLAVLSLALMLTACGGDGGEAKPPKRDSGTFTEEKDTGADEEEPEAGSDSEDAGDVNDAGDAGAGEDTLQASAAEAKTKNWVEGCYKKPSINKEFLNSCATGWRKFDKTLYPSSWKEGEALPTLP